MGARTHPMPHRAMCAICFSQRTTTKTQFWFASYAFRLPTETGCVQIHNWWKVISPHLNVGKDRWSQAFQTRKPSDKGTGSRGSRSGFKPRPHLWDAPQAMASLSPHQEHRPIDSWRHGVMSPTHVNTEQPHVAHRLFFLGEDEAWLADPLSLEGTRLSTQGHTVLSCKASTSWSIQMEARRVHRHTSWNHDKSKS